MPLAAAAVASCGSAIADTAGAADGIDVERCQPGRAGAAVVAAAVDEAVKVLEGLVEKIRMGEA